MVRPPGHVCQDDQSIHKRLALNYDLRCLPHEARLDRKTISHHQRGSILISPNTVIYMSTVEFS